MRSVWKALGLCLPIFTAIAVSAADELKKLSAGDVAPPFTGKDQDGKVWKLEDFRGKSAVLLYFYPKDDTPGCTKEACGFRDRLDELSSKGVKVIGVSFDSAESHKSFINKHGLNFTLLSDTGGKIADLYGARMPGKEMARRVSFLIGKDGKISHVTDTPSADTHLSEMKEAVAGLSRG